MSIRKVAYIGPILDATGYSKAAVGYIQALLAAGIQVASRPVRMTNTFGPVPQSVAETFDNDLHNIDAVIQHNLPSEWSYRGGVINAGMYAYETLGFADLPWKYNIQQMDRVIVFCQEQKNVLASEDDPVDKKKIHVVPHVVHAPVENPPPLDLDLPDNCMKFYAIGETNKRKNFPALLLAYFSAFSCNDNVALIIKTSNPQKMTKMIQSVRQGCNRFPHPDFYPPVILLPGRLTDEQMASLHASCDVYVCSSFGESWNLPASEALSYGKMIVVPDAGAFRDYTRDLGVRICTHETLCYPEETGLYSSNQVWQVVDTSLLSKSLWDIYEHRDQCLDAGSARARREFVTAEFSPKKVGEKLVLALSS